MELNLSDSNPHGVFAYNDYLRERILLNGKSITKPPNEIDSFNSDVSPLIYVLHAPTGKVSKGKSWFHKDGRIWTLCLDSSIIIENKNTDFKYIISVDDVGERRGNSDPAKYYDLNKEEIDEASKHYYFSRDKDLNEEVLQQKSNREYYTYERYIGLKSDFTIEDLDTSWFKKYMKLNYRESIFGDVRAFNFSKVEFMLSNGVVDKGLVSNLGSCRPYNLLFAAINKRGCAQKTLSMIDLLIDNGVDYSFVMSWRYHNSKHLNTLSILDYIVDECWLSEDYVKDLYFKFKKLGVKHLSRKHEKEAIKKIKYN